MAEQPVPRNEQPAGAGFLRSLRFGNCTLRPWYVLFIAVTPLLVYLASERLLGSFALNFGAVPEYFTEFDRHRAEAARLGSVGAFFLMAAAAAAAFAYFLYTLRLLEKRSALLVAAVFLATVVTLSVMSPAQSSPHNTAYSGSGLLCAALTYGDVEKPLPVEKGPPPKVKVSDARVDGACPAGAHRQVRSLLAWNQFAVLLGLASLIFGSICCLAGPSGGTPDPMDLPHWEEQSERLNGYLYLSAILLVTGLMFVAAMLKWPSFALLAPASYEAHVNALTAYYGFTYTVLLGSFYVPVAMILSGRVKKLKAAPTSGGKVPEAFKGPLQLLKIAAAIFSTSLAPIVAGLMSL